MQGNQGGCPNLMPTALNRRFNAVYNFKIRLYTYLYVTKGYTVRYTPLLFYSAQKRFYP